MTTKEATSDLILDQLEDRLISESEAMVNLVARAGVSAVDAVWLVRGFEPSSEIRAKRYVNALYRLQMVCVPAPGIAWDDLPRALAA